ncbi:hypothetical protein [Paenibacillus sp. J22TS3]|uniref:hypothetical protein n=1 Tax=Paenibacillus sp. J22TS3 TaxID=2807192 RepID=UPI001B0F0C7B|nr:hypothetical protein [Paenibacillus sp. J22TS3]GIP21299.1 hypothetical protein J22TS3_15740 [Paenibacillus sp. J22TS3]
MFILMLTILPNKPLKSNFAIPPEYLAKDISHLAYIAGTQYSKSSIQKLTNILRRKGFYTVEDVVNANAKHIQLISHIGDKSLKLLLDLLSEMSGEPRSVHLDRANQTIEADH